MYFALVKKPVPFKIEAYDRFNELNGNICEYIYIYFGNKHMISGLM